MRSKELYNLSSWFCCCFPTPILLSWLSQPLFSHWCFPQQIHPCIPPGILRNEDEATTTDCFLFIQHKVRTHSLQQELCISTRSNLKWIEIYLDPSQRRKPWTTTQSQLQFSTWHYENIRPHHVDSCGKTNGIITFSIKLTWSSISTGKTSLDFTREVIKHDKGEEVTKNIGSHPVPKNLGWHPISRSHSLYIQ